MDAVAYYVPSLVSDQEEEVVVCDLLGIPVISYRSEQMVNFCRMFLVQSIDDTISIDKQISAARDTLKYFVYGVNLVLDEDLLPDYIREDKS